MKKEELKTNENQKRRGRLLPVLGFTAILLAFGIISFVAYEQYHDRANLKAELEHQQTDMQSKYLNSFAEIEANLSEISAHESVIRQNMMSGPNETPLSAEERVNQEIAIIQALIESNNRQIEELESELGSSNKELANYSDRNKRLERRLASFNKKIEELEERNLLLTQELEGVKTDRDSIQYQLVSTEDENALLLEGIKVANETNTIQSERIDKLVSEVNQSYFVVGEYKDLKKMNVVEKEGALIGLGGDKQLKEDFDKSVFTPINRSSYRTIPVFAKKAELATNHPEESYAWVEDEDGVQWLEIIDPIEFWEASRYLVILTDDGLGLFDNTSA